MDRQRRTGLGEYIDLAQTEAALHFIAPALLEASATNRIASGVGNDDPDMIPHGAFPCLGEDQWVAIAVENDQNWQALCRTIGRVDLAEEDSLMSAAGRRLSQTEIDDAIRAWTSTRSAAEITDSLVRVGVAAHQIQSSAECLSDPQLEHRGAFVWLEHPDRRCVVENARFQLSRSEHGPKVRAPFLGEHTFEILSDLVGYSSERIADLAAAEVLE